MLLGVAGGEERVSAQIFPPRGDDTTPSMGVFRVIVVPAFTNLFAPAVGLNGYPGYHSADARLTSPVLIDNTTMIGRSDRHDRLLAGSVPVGLPIMDNLGYGDYVYKPAIFAFAPPPTEEILTQIRHLALSTTLRSDQCPNDPRIPTVPVNWLMVYGGFDFFGTARKSIGMVQELTANGAPNPDFPARSFFDIFVEVNLPPVPLTASIGAFPAAGAILYNDASSPLVVTNLSISSLPPQVVYIHGDTPGVQLKFRDNNPPYWNADDVLGYLVLAGHGTFTNNCANEAALVDATLGPLGTSRPELPVPWLFQTDLCPSPGATYNSVKDIDIVTFPVSPGISLLARNFVHGNFPTPISPPPTNNAAAYTAGNTLVTLQVSLDGGQTWGSAQGNGLMIAVIRHGSNDIGNTRMFDTELLQLNISGESAFGPFLLRESPTRTSSGKHTIQNHPQGFLVTSFFDVFLEVSTDNGINWIPADRAIHVAVDQAPRCGVPGSKLHLTRSGRNGAISWSDPSYKLQSRSSLAPGTTWGDVGGSSPVSVTLTDKSVFYRITCQ